MLLTEDMVGQRFDAALTQSIEVVEEGWSRTRMRQLITGGDVTIGEGVMNDPSQKVKAALVDQVALIVVPDPKSVGIVAENIPLDILFEDDTVIVLDKPAGMVVHPAAGNYSGTLVNAIAYHVGPGLLSVGGEDRPGIVHRLDKDTSGLMVVAKDEVALASLQQQFAWRSIERAYLAMVAGPIWKKEARIEGDIGRDSKNRKKMAVVKRNGKEAVTNFKVLERFGEVACLVECRLETGRTHQIRVHMQSIGHGLIGDPMYPPARGFGIDFSLRQFPRQALHARLLGFDHPKTGERLRFERDVPEDFRNLMERFAEIHPRLAFVDEEDFDDEWDTEWDDGVEVLMV